MVISIKKNMKEAFNAQKYNKTIKKSKNIMYGGGEMGPIDQAQYDKLVAEKNTYIEKIIDLQNDFNIANNILKIYNKKENESYNMYKSAHWISAKNERITDENISKMVEMKNKYDELNIKSKVYDEALSRFKELYYKKSWF